MTNRRFSLTVLALLLSQLCGGRAAMAQANTGLLRGTIDDPSGAVVPAASVTLSNSEGFTRTLKSSATGTYEFTRLVPGRYALTVTAKGFDANTASDILVYGDKPTTQNVQLIITVQSEVDVQSDSVGVSTSPDDNASALVIKGKDLDALSDDPDELQDELTALAGPSAGPSGGQIYIDGFTGGQLPPKSSIREIRINRNPFSAAYDKLGYGRIEILTKPGTDKFRGSVMINGNDSAFNSLNPFVTSEPAYYSTFFMGNASGPITKSTSWFASVFRRDNASNSVINAQIPDANGNSTTYTAAVPNPQSRLDINPRFDLQLGQNNTLTIRYMFDRTAETNSGVSGIALQSQAYNVLNYEHILQLSDTQIISPKIVNDLHFQYMADRDNQTATSTAPTITVSGSFIGGGNNSGVTHDNQDRFEFSDNVTATAGKHALNIGTRLRLAHEVNATTAGFNGSFVYNSIADEVSGKASQYSVTAGKSTASVNLFDAALYYQDDWSINPALTFSYGLRYEAQNRISDHADLAPRLLLAWAPAAAHGKKASTVLRFGYGWFYDRFSQSYVLDAIHQNGINQQSYVVKNPTFSTANIPTATQLASISTAAPTIDSVSPTMRASLNMQAAAGIDHSFGRFATVSATYVNSRGVHQYLSDNINAYIPSTYDYATATGTRPNGINENIDQFQSGGVYNQNQLTVNYSVHAKKLSLFGFYSLGFAKADTSGATYFPSTQTNPGADYGRASFDVRHRFLLGGNYQGPFGISLSPFLDLNSGSPFNITLAQDLNGDNQYNDRPAYATATSTNTQQTAWGNFDLSPTANEARIPYDLGTGPSAFSLNMRVAKSFGIGPRVAAGSAANGGFGGPGGPGGPGGGHGGPGGGGLGPGGLGGSNGPPRLDQQLPRRYSLNFSAMVHNVFNDVNLAAPNGTLGQANFGKSTALAGGFFGSAASNRSIQLQAMFNF
jgi:hypothetical protein